MHTKDKPLQSDPFHLTGLNGSQLAENEKVYSLHVPYMKFIG